jgi:hypothetical protein
MIVYDNTFGPSYATPFQRLRRRIKRRPARLWRWIWTHATYTDEFWERATDRNCSACDASDIKVCVNHA